MFRDWLKRIAAPMFLVIVAPLVAEYLLGDVPLTQIVLLPMLALFYGCGVLLVRELARRAGGGWPMILALGLAFGIIEEGLVTQSLFNPHYVGRRLLKYGYIPWLGMGSRWTIFVLLLHVEWSIGVPIALSEGLFRARAEAPWLGQVGVFISAIKILPRQPGRS